MSGADFRASVERRAAYMGVEALRDEVARLKALLKELAGIYPGTSLAARIDAALKSPSGDIPQCTRAATPAPTDADRRETGRISSTTPPPGASQVGAGGDVARECQTMSDPTTADRRGEDGEAVDAAGGGK